MKDKKREESAKTGPGSSKNGGLGRMLEGGDEEAFTPAYLEIQKRPPAPLARTMAYTLMGVVIVAFLWAFLSEFDIVVTAPGKVVPSDRIKLVQPFETGIVKAIHVRDGQAVKAGQILIELDPTSSQADRNRLSRDVLETGDYTFEFHPEVEQANTGALLADLVVTTQRCQNALEAIIRRNPGQWLWFHRRWKSRERLDEEWKRRDAHYTQ